MLHACAPCYEGTKRGDRPTPFSTNRQVVAEHDQGLRPCSQSNLKPTLMRQHDDHGLHSVRESTFTNLPMPLWVEQCRGQQELRSRPPFVREPSGAPSFSFCPYLPPLLSELYQLLTTLRPPKTYPPRHRTVEHGRTQNVSTAFSCRLEKSPSHKRDSIGVCLASLYHTAEQQKQPTMISNMFIFQQLRRFPKGSQRVAAKNDAAK